MLNINKYKLGSAQGMTWGDILGDISKQEDLQTVLTGYAKKTELPSLTGYATKTWVEGKGYLTEHQSIKTINGESILGTGDITIEGGGGGLSLDEVDEEIDTKLTGYATQSWVEGKGYLTSHQSLANYALKSELPSLTGYATESWVEGKGYLTEHQDLSDYATLEDLPSEKPSFVITMEWDNDCNPVITSTKSHLDTIASYIENNGGDSANVFLVEGVMYFKASMVCSGDGFYQFSFTDGYLNSIVLSADMGEDSEVFIEFGSPLMNNPDDAYATESWVEGKGYLTSHQSLANYALKSELPSLTGYATQSWVTEQLGALTTITTEILS